MKKKNKAGANINSFIGKDAVFDGKLSFLGTVRIDGKFKGEIHASGNLIIGEEGQIDADIHAASIICSGEIRGSMVADNVIDIRVPGKVFGDMEAPTIVIQEGVIFEGRCRTQKPAKLIEDKSEGFILAKSETTPSQQAPA